MSAYSQFLRHSLLSKRSHTAQYIIVHKVIVWKYVYKKLRALYVNMVWNHCSRKHSAWQYSTGCWEECFKRKSFTIEYSDTQNQIKNAFNTVVINQSQTLMNLWWWCVHDLCWVSESEVTPHVTRPKHARVFHILLKVCSPWPHPHQSR